MLSILTALACSTGAPPTVAPPLVPDDSFEVELGRRWNLIGDGLTPGHDSLELSVNGSAGQDTILVWLNGQPAEGLAGAGSSFSGSIAIADLEPGTHSLLLSADNGDTAFAQVEFARSAALYAIVTIDWDTADTADDELAWHDELHQTYPSLRLTQLVGPYTFTDPAMSVERQAGFVSWLRANETDHGDETGLHIHPWCTFIDQTSLPCLTDTSYVYADGDTTGYSVPLWAYSLDQQITMLDAAVDIFLDNGLDAPTSFRAGAWMAEENLLQALSQTGFVADSSALNTPLIEDEWGTFGEDQGDGYNNLLWDWNAEHWSTIGATSQPYHPSAQDAQAPGDLSILQVPDNAALADYVSTDDMAAVLDANWTGEPLDHPIAYSLGFHNRTHGIGFSFQDDFEGMLDILEDHLADNDDGPVIYITLSEAALVWP